MTRELGISLSLMFVLGIVLVLTKVLAFFGYTALIVVLISLLAIVLDNIRK